jgi:hypothetical protein
VAVAALTGVRTATTMKANVEKNFNQYYMVRCIRLNALLFLWGSDRPGKETNLNSTILFILMINH